MQQVFCHYTKWEDWAHGYYKTRCDNAETLTALAKEILCNSQEFEAAMRNLILEWPVSSDVNLTNMGSNRKAWLGAAACCYLYGIPEFITRMAWNSMTDHEQITANVAANNIIREYEDRIAN